MTERPEVMDRKEAIARVQKIYEMSAELSRCGHRDLESRASEVHAMAAHMLYDLGEPG